MTDARRDDELRQLLALAAVGALDRAERDELDAAIAERPDLQAELAELEDAAAVLADDVSAPPPPPLRAAVLRAIEDVAERPPAEPAPSPPGPVLSLDAARDRRRRWMPAVAAAVAVAVLAGVVVAVAVDDDAGVDVAAVVADADATVIPLEGELSGLRLVHSAAHDATAIVGDDVPAPGEDRVYELWRIEGDRAPERVEIFRPADGGVVEVLLPGSAPSAGAIYAVTIEPPGGSDQPTGDIIASSTT
jgi:anti-sigma-K factor RskA